MILVQVCQCSSAKFASEPGLHYFQKKLQRQYLYLLQHLDSSLNTGPCLLKLLGVLAPITVLLCLLELHLSLSSFSWEAPPSQLPGSIFLPLLHHPFGAAARRVRPLGPWQAGASLVQLALLHLPECSSLFLTSCCGTSLSCSLCVSERLFVCDLSEFSLYKSSLPQKCSLRRKLNMYIQKDLHVRHHVSYSFCILSASFLPASRTFLHFSPHNMFLQLSRQLSATCF